MRFSLRTLLFLMLLAGPLSALAWRTWVEYRARLAEIEAVRSASIQWQSAVMTSRQLTPGTAAEQEIWNEQQSKISWESFPESTPTRP